MKLSMGKPLYAAMIGGAFSIAGVAHADTMIRFETNLGTFDVRLFDEDTPQTVANFLNYVQDGDYTDTIVHRSISGFVIQGGGFSAAIPPTSIPTDPPVVNESGISNVRGTIAMAKLGGAPNSATSQWFINLNDNSGVGALPDGSDDPFGLDFQNGGFTVFGEVVDMTVVDQIAGVPSFNAGALFGAAFTNLPLINFDTTTPPTLDNLVTIQSVFVVPEPGAGTIGALLLASVWGITRGPRYSSLD